MKIVETMEDATDIPRLSSRAFIEALPVNTIFRSQGNSAVYIRLDDMAANLTEGVSLPFAHFSVTGPHDYEVLPNAYLVLR